MKTRQGNFELLDIESILTRTVSRRSEPSLIYNEYWHVWIPNPKTNTVIDTVKNISEKTKKQ